MPIFWLVFSLLFSPIFALDIDSQGEIGLGLRLFEGDDLSQTQDQQLMLFVENQAKTTLEIGEFKLGFISRVDSKEKDRSFFALTETNFLYQYSNQLQFIAGYKLFDWSELEAFHPADQINSRNFDSHFYDYQKFGELTFGGEFFYEGLKAGLYFFPYFKKPHYPSQRSRLGEQYDVQESYIQDGSQVDEDQKVFQMGLSVESDKRPSSEGDFWRVHYLRLVDRWRVLYGTHQYTFNGANNTYTPNRASAITTSPNAYHALMNQLGGSWQYRLDDWVLKTEAATRWYSEGSTVLTKRGLRTVVDHTEVGLGVEKKFSTSFGEATSFLEFGGLFDLNKRTRGELSYLQRDLVLGSWLNLDNQDKAHLKASVMLDLERSKEYALEVLGKQRVNAIWSVESGLRYFYAPSSTTIPSNLEILHKDSYLFTRLTRSF